MRNFQITLYDFVNHYSFMKYENKKHFTERIVANMYAIKQGKWSTTKNMFLNRFLYKEKDA